MSHKNIKLKVNTNDIKLLNSNSINNTKNNGDSFTINKMNEKKSRTKEVSVNLDEETKSLFYPTVNVNVIKSIDGGRRKTSKKRHIRTKSKEGTKVVRNLRKDLKRDLGTRKRSEKKYILKSKVSDKDNESRKRSVKRKIVKSKSIKNRVLKKRRSKRMSKKRYSSRKVSNKKISKHKVNKVNKENKENKVKKSVRRNSKKRDIKGGGKLTWAGAVGEARRNLNIVGFQPIKKGSELYIEAKKIYEDSKLDK